MAFASVNYGGDPYFGPKWFDFKGPNGTVSERASYESAARRVAAERLGCAEEELVCTGWTPATSRFVYQK